MGTFARIAGESRGPNTTPLPFDLIRDSAFKVVSWNARGLAMAVPADRSRMFCYLRRLAVDKHIICLQEVHGLEEEVLAEVRSNLPGWGCLHSPILSPEGVFVGGYAGVAILTCRILTQAAQINHRVLVPGRAHLADIIYIVVGRMMRAL